MEYLFYIVVLIVAYKIVMRICFGIRIIVEAFIEWIPGDHPKIKLFLSTFFKELKKSKATLLRVFFANRSIKKIDVSR